MRLVVVVQNRIASEDSISTTSAVSKGPTRCTVYLQITTVLAWADQCYRVRDSYPASCNVAETAAARGCACSAAATAILPEFL